MQKYDTENLLFGKRYFLTLKIHRLLFRRNFLNGFRRSVWGKGFSICLPGTGIKQIGKIAENRGRNRAIGCTVSSTIWRTNL